VDLVQVDVIGLQPRQTGLDLARDPQPRVATLVVPLPHLAVDLRGQDDLVPSTSKRPSHDLLGSAVRIDVRGVDEVDPGIECRVDHADGFVLVGVAPVAEHHGPEAVRAHLHAGSPQRSILHRARSFPFAVWAPSPSA
jgi:hypothetical protein